MYLGYVPDMMAFRRSKDQILSEILVACQGNGEKKTRIVYRINLNFKTIIRHLDILLSNGLLEKIDGPTVLYRTTEKGMRLLERMKKIEMLMSGYEDAPGSRSQGVHHDVAAERTDFPRSG